MATLGIPIIVGQLGTIIQGLADTIMVGRFSAHSLAAAGFVNNIMVLVLIFALGYSYAITPVIGPMHARGEFENAGKALKAGLQVNGALGMVLFLLMGTLYFFLGHMGQPEELLPKSGRTTSSSRFPYPSNPFSMLSSNSSTVSATPVHRCGL